MQDSWIKCLTKGCRGLTSLNLKGCYRLTGDGLAALVACPTLGDLNIGGCGMVTDASLELIAVGCPLLRRLCLAGCVLITDAAMALLPVGVVGLDISNCTGVGDAGVEAVAARCHGLSEILLKGCHRVTDRAMAALAVGCRALELIDLGLCPRLTDAGLGRLAAMPRLVSVKLHGCDRVTAAGVQAIVVGAGARTPAIEGVASVRHVHLDIEC